MSYCCWCTCGVWYAGNKTTLASHCTCVFDNLATDASVTAFTHVTIVGIQKGPKCKSYEKSNENQGKYTECY